MNERESLFPAAREALGRGRATAIAQAIADEPPAHTLGREVAAAKEPFDAALAEMLAAQQLLYAAKSCLLDVAAVCSQQEAVEVALTRAGVHLNTTLAALTEALP